METYQKIENSDNILLKYLNLMLEIRRRENVIIEIQDGIYKARYLIVDYEVIYFQLRKILEIIVKAPLLINESQYRSISNKPQDDWRIRDIMNKLAKINPNFYPQPINIIKRENQPDEFVHKENGFLTKEELCDTYDYCNSYLHAQNPLKDESQVNFDIEWNRIVLVINKIHSLLNSHICYPSIEGNFYYFVSMDKGKGFPNGNIFFEKL